MQICESGAGTDTISLQIILVNILHIPEEEPGRDWLKFRREKTRLLLNFL